MHYKHTTKRRRKKRGEIFDLENDEEVEIPTAGDEFCNSRGHFHFFPRESEFFQREKRRRREERKRREREREKRRSGIAFLSRARRARRGNTKEPTLILHHFPAKRINTARPRGPILSISCLPPNIYILSLSLSLALSLSPASPKGHV